MISRNVQDLFDPRGRVAIVWGDAATGIFSKLIGRAMAASGGGANVFLAPDAASAYITGGTTIPLDGGYTAK